MGEFYVYVHRRPDTGAAFYVGKGKGRRAWVKQHRNPYWRAVVAKAGGYLVETKVERIDEEAAHLAEMELIDVLRRRGLKLTNLTDGGEGLAGYKRSAESIERGASKRRGVPNVAASIALKGRPKSQLHRANLSAAKLGKSTATAETRAKLSAANKGRTPPNKGKKHQPETIEKIRAANTGELNKFFGRKHTPETLARLSASHIGHRDSDETRRRKSEARMGEKNPRFGIQIPEDQKERQIASLKSRPRVTCPHCSLVLDESNAKRWHFGKCRESK